MPVIPQGNPNTSGGNNPAVVAAMGNIRQGAMQQAAAPPDQQMPQADGNAFGQLLAQALQMYVASQGAPEFTEQLRQFFEAFVQIAAEMQQGIQGQAATPGAGPPPGVANATPQAAPQPPAGPTAVMPAG
jgi:hypothetical protein